MSPQIHSEYASDGLMTRKSFIPLQLPSVGTIEVTTECSKAEL